MNSILDAVLAVALVFAVFALIASGVQEAIASWLNLRGKQLFSALEQVMKTNAIGLFKKPLLEPLTRKNKTPPAQPTSGDTKQAKKEAGKAAGSYIPSWAFSATVVDAALVRLVDNATKADAEESDQTALEDQVGGPLAEVIKALWTAGANTKDTLEAELAKWYDSYMERVNGWYKRQTKVILFVIACVIAALANVDAVSLTQTVVNNASVRTVLAQQAVNTDECPPGSSLNCGKEALAQLPGSQLGLFWTASCTESTEGGKKTCSTPLEQRGLNDWQDYVLKVAGLLLGAFAISLGAPFWFDLIGRGKALKSAGETPAPASGTT